MYEGPAQVAKRASVRRLGGDGLPLGPVPVRLLRVAGAAAAPPVWNVILDVHGEGDAMSDYRPVLVELAVEAVHQSVFLFQLSLKFVYQFITLADLLDLLS